jgi:hypothetical protein
LITIAFSWAAFSMYLYRLYASYEIFDLLKQRTTEPNTYIRLQYISYCNETLGIFLAFCSAFGTLRFLKLLRFNKKIIIYMIAFKKSLAELLSFGLIFMIYWMSMVQAFFIVFNIKSLQFASIVKSMETCFQMILGKFEVDSLIQANAFFGTTLLIVYNIFVVFILVNILISILIENFAEIKMDNSLLNEEDPDLFNYLKSAITQFLPKSKNDSRVDINSDYKSSIDLFPNKINRLLNKIERSYFEGSYIKF